MEPSIDYSLESTYLKDILAHLKDMEKRDQIPRGFWSFFDLKRKELIEAEIKLKASKDELISGAREILVRRTIDPNYFFTENSFLTQTEEEICIEHFKSEFKLPWYKKIFYKATDLEKEKYAKKKLDEIYKDAIGMEKQKLLDTLKSNLITDSVSEKFIKYVIKPDHIKDKSRSLIGFYSSFLSRFNLVLENIKEFSIKEDQLGQFASEQTAQSRNQLSNHGNGNGAKNSAADIAEAIPPNNTEGIEMQVFPPDAQKLNRRKRDLVIGKGKEV